MVLRNPGSDCNARSFSVVDSVFRFRTPVWSWPRKQPEETMILVTGDVVLDHNIYAGQRFTPDSD